MSQVIPKRFYDAKHKTGIVTEEWKIIRRRREELFGVKKPLSSRRLGQAKGVEADLLEEDPPEDLIGIALSGGGIRSATFNLGFLRALNARGLLKRADYLSTVSGGGYIGAYVQEHLRATGSYGTLFVRKEMDRFRDYGDYLRPGKGLRKGFESLNFLITFVGMTLLHLVWYLLFFAWMMQSAVLIGEWIPAAPERVVVWITVLLSAVVAWYYFAHALRYFSRRFWSSRPLFYLISILVLLLGLLLYSRLEGGDLPQSLTGFDSMGAWAMMGVVVFAVGIFANSNILTLHRYYRFRLSSAFLKGSHRTLNGLLRQGRDGGEWTVGPYPLINTTLNLQADRKITGVKSCDYYLLSPLYCGAKLTGYLPTHQSEYHRMTLATAMTVSGAALNPQMGYKVGRGAAFALTLLNIRLGYWALNPALFRSENPVDKFAAAVSTGRLKALPSFWPFYNLAELMGRMNLERWRINLSDGGQIENLGVFELLRRRCRLIIVADAGADPEYTFGDLRNLQVRARNELGLAIEFAPREEPDRWIRPDTASGFSRREYTTARIRELSPGKGNASSRTIGCLVYVKAAVTAQQYVHHSGESDDAFFAYKNYHPDFPHESTVDQFFDPRQWTAYRRLGEKIGLKLLKGLNRHPDPEEIFRFFCWQTQRGEKV